MGQPVLKIAREMFPFTAVGEAILLETMFQMWKLTLTLNLNGKLYPEEWDRAFFINRMRQLVGKFDRLRG